MEIQHHHFNNGNDFLNFFLNWNNDMSNYIFRGHADSSWTLLPSVLREDEKNSSIESGMKNDSGIDMRHSEYIQMQIEYGLIRQFYIKADRQGLRLPNSSYLRRNLTGILDPNVNEFLHGREVWIPEELYDCAALAQHYRIPTRLLDWTYDPFVAVFFALKGAIERKGDLCIWCLNNAVLTDVFLQGTFSPVKFITPPYYDNPNLNAQKGLFTHIPTKIDIDKSNARNTLVDKRSLDKILSEDMIEYQYKDHLMKIITLPCSSAEDAYFSLFLQGYGCSRIYAGFDGVAMELMDQTINKKLMMR